MSDIDGQRWNSSLRRECLQEILDEYTKLHTCLNMGANTLLSESVR